LPSWARSTITSLRIGSPSLNPTNSGRRPSPTGTLQAAFFATSGHANPIYVFLSLRIERPIQSLRPATA
jgi:hypothetical protein